MEIKPRQWEKVTNASDAPREGFRKTGDSLGTLRRLIADPVQDLFPLNEFAVWNPSRNGLSRWDIMLLPFYQNQARVKNLILAVSV
jgi:hypothetical protein